jgi:hypothetical protein
LLKAPCRWCVSRWRDESSPNLVCRMLRKNSTPVASGVGVIEADFTNGYLASDGVSLLPRQADQVTRLTRAAASNDLLNLRHLRPVAHCEARPTPSVVAVTLRCLPNWPGTPQDSILISINLSGAAKAKCQIVFYFDVGLVRQLNFEIPFHV